MSCELKTTRWRRARVAAPTAVESALATTVAAQPSAFFALEGWRGGRIRFYSNGANDETFTATLYDVNQDMDGGWQTQSLGTIACTVGSSAAVPGTIGYDLNLTGNKLWVDTMVWTATTYGTAMLTRVGGNIAAFNPANNTIAELLVSDFGAAQGIAIVITTFGLTAARFAMPIIKVEV